jgi:hypothetical protein
VLEYVVAKSSL